MRQKEKQIKWLSPDERPDAGHFGRQLQKENRSVANKTGCAITHIKDVALTDDGAQCIVMGRKQNFGETRYFAFPHMLIPGILSSIPVEGSTAPLL